MKKIILLNVIVLNLCISSCKKKDPEPKPTLSDVTLISKDIYSKTIQIKATVLDEGTSAATERGFCYNTVGNPSVSDIKVLRQFGKGEYSYTIENCSIDLTYYIKAYAMNSNGITYSTELKVSFFSTIPEIQIKKTPNTQSANINIDVTKDGQASIQLIGCRISSTDLSQDSSKYFAEKFGNNVTFDSLVPNTKYYLMAFAKNKNGSAILFDTIRTLIGSVAEIEKPNITRLEANYIDVGSSVLSFGGSSIKEQGFIISTSSINNFNSGSSYKASLSNFNLRINQLTENTTYFLRAYAINSAGINLSPEISFKTNYYNLGDFKEGGFIYWTSGSSYKVVSYMQTLNYPKYTWGDAATFADTSTLYGFSDWSMPDKSELSNACIIGAIRNDAEFWTINSYGPNYHNIYSGCTFGGSRDDIPHYIALIRQPK